MHANNLHLRDPRLVVWGRSAAVGFAAVMLCAGLLQSGAAGADQEAETILTVPDASDAQAASSQLLKLGAGDVVEIQVYGQPSLTTTTDVSSEGTITLPLAGVVYVAGLSPADAAHSVAVALQDGQYVVNPQVTIMMRQFRSQQVSVLGEVKAPGRFPIESKTTVFDLLAQAGGTSENAADTVFVLRPGANGEVVRHALHLSALGSGGGTFDIINPQGGDIVFVPRAEQFYIYGEVQAPNRYRLEPGETVVQAITRGGGITPRGSEHRVEIRRRGADGKDITFNASLTDVVQANDVIRVKERIF